jgi:hypothetical protein
MYWLDDLMIYYFTYIFVTIYIMYCVNDLLIRCFTDLFIY